jgi:hypothetical protein
MKLFTCLVTTVVSLAACCPEGQVLVSNVCVLAVAHPESGPGPVVGPTPPVLPAPPIPPSPSPEGNDGTITSMPIGPVPKCCKGRGPYQDDGQ